MTITDMKHAAKCVIASKGEAWFSAHQLAIVDVPISLVDAEFIAAASPKSIMTLLAHIDAQAARIAELENDEVRQRLANAEHQLHMKDLAINNIKTSRRAQFKKRSEAEKELAALREQEPVETVLKYSSALPKFLGETNNIESYSCFIHGNTPPRKTQKEAYADAKAMCGPLYSQPTPVAVPLELLAAMEEVIRISDREHEAWHRAKAAIEVLRLNSGSKSDD